MERKRKEKVRRGDQKPLAADHKGQKREGVTWLARENCLVHQWLRNPQAVFIFITRPSYEENSMPGDGKDEPAAKGYKEVGSGG